MPEVKKKEKILEDLGLTLDPKAYPHLRLRDPDVAEAYEKALPSLRHSYEHWDIPHPTDSERTYAQDLTKEHRRVLKRDKKAGKMVKYENDKGAGWIMEASDVARVGRKLAAEYKVDKHKETDWLDMLNDGGRGSGVYKDLLREQEAHLFAEDGFLHGYDPHRQGHLRRQREEEKK